MSNNTAVVTASANGTGWTLFLVFLVLKLTGVIAWSWLWVTAPLWIPAAVALAIFILIALILGIVRIFESDDNRKRREARASLKKYADSLRP